MNIAIFSNFVSMKKGSRLIAYLQSLIFRTQTVQTGNHYPTQKYSKKAEVD